MICIQCDVSLFVLSSYKSFNMGVQFFLHSQCLLLAGQAPVSGHLSLYTSSGCLWASYGHLFRILRLSAYQSFHCISPGIYSMSSWWSPCTCFSSCRRLLHSNPRTFVISGNVKWGCCCFTSARRLFMNLTYLHYRQKNEENCTECIKIILATVYMYRQLLDRRHLGMGLSHAPLFCIKTKDFACLGSQWKTWERVWTCKNKGFHSPGNQHGHCVKKVYTCN